MILDISKDLKILENESVCIVSDFLREKINQMNTYKIASII
jgi:hypothetical protein